MKQTTVLSTVLAGALVLGTGVATAHEAGDFIARAGVVNVNPKSDNSSALDVNGAALVGSGVEVDDDTQLGLTFTYMLTDHLGIELLAATPFEHDIKADLGVLNTKVDAGSTKHLPPTVSLQYFPMEPSSKFQPYMGVGLNYTTFFSEDLDSELENTLGSKGNLKLDDSFGLAASVGFDYQIDEHWLVNAAVWWVDIDTDAKIKLDNGTVIKADVTIDPMVYLVSVGYKF